MGTTPESVRHTVEHALSQEIDVAVFSLYRPPPGSPAFDALNWGPEDYINCFKLQKEAVYVPDRYESLDQVETVFKEAYRTFYLDPRFIKHSAKRALADPILAKNVMRGALALADQFRPSFLRRSRSSQPAR